MPMLRIEGFFRIVGAQPDGDSIRFIPSRKGDWDKLGFGHRVRVNKAGGAQLRLDGIDTLETHYSPITGGLGILHQPLAGAHAAADALLKFVGFNTFERTAKETITSSEPIEVPGHIFTRFADTYGRCVAFAYPAEHPGANGSWVKVTPNDLERSANYHLLENGHAYPTYYSKLYHDLRKHMTAAVVRARASEKGIWKVDAGATGFPVSGLDDITNRHTILPKLFRRLVDFLALAEVPYEDDIPAFKAYLADRNDRVLVLDQGQFTGLDSVVEVTANRIRLTTPPENLVFSEK